MNWFLPIFVFASLSVRSPNVLPNPYDYEVSVGLEHKTFFVNRQWERELGEYYLDEEYWVAGSPGILWIRERYLNKTSKDIQYNQVDLRYVFGNFSAGYALRHSDSASHRLVVGFGGESHWKLLGASGTKVSRYEISSDFARKVWDYSIYLKRRVKISKSVGIYGLLQEERAGDKNDFQVKVGFEVELPSG